MKRLFFTCALLALGASLLAGPAVRFGDGSAHGGTIVGGALTGKVRINGGFPVIPGPASMHVCPLVEPGTPPVPHVGGPITGPPLSTKTRVYGLPIVLHGAMATCIGPPDSILGGSPNVRINK